MPFLPEKLRELRRGALGGLGMTQGELAERLGLKPAIISQWENAYEGKTPDIETIERMAGIFNVDVDELYTFDKKKPEKPHTPSDCEKLCEGMNELDRAMIRMYSALSMEGKQQVRKVCEEQAQRFHREVQAS